MRTVTVPVRGPASPAAPRPSDGRPRYLPAPFRKDVHVGQPGKLARTDPRCPWRGVSARVVARSGRRFACSTKKRRMGEGSPSPREKTANGESHLLEAEQLSDRLLVGGRELVAVELVRPHPAVIVHADVLDRAARVLATVDAEVDVVALVGVLDVDHASAYRDGDPHLLPQFARQRLLIALAGLDAPTGELPQERQRCVRRTLGDEVLSIALDHRPDHADLPAHVLSTGHATPRRCVF